MSIKKDIVWRVGLVYLVVFLFAVLIASKVVFLKFVDDKKWKEIAQEVRIRNFKVSPARGDIYASDLRLLASSVPYYEVRLDMRTEFVTEKIFRDNIDSLSHCLSVLFRDKPQAMYKRELINARRAGDRYFLLKDNVNYLQLKKLKTFPIFRLGRNKGGIIFVPRTMRVRPHEDLARRTIGFVTDSKTDNDVGLEGGFNKYLGGTEGYQKMQKLSGGAWMPVSDDNQVDPKDGSSIVTTIDIDLQDVAHKALLEQLRLHGAQYGTAVLMEVASGDIKAMVNLSRTGNDYREIYNYAVGASTEPGSTFKVPAIMIALEDGAYDLNDTVDTENGKYAPSHDFTIRDESSEHGGYGKISVQQVIEKSSNVGMAKLINNAYKRDPKKFVDHLHKMSLKEPLNIAIPGEGLPRLNYPGDPLWSGVSLPQMAYGYEVTLTPLHILAFYNAIANGGKMVKPRFVKEIRNKGKIEQSFPVEIINPSICSRSTLKKVHKMLEGVVERGTAVNLKASHFQIAGKTGTTQIFNERYGYKGAGIISYQASFVGYFPSARPKYSCIVVINAPSKNVYYGNQVAGPVFLEIANKVYATSLELQPAVNNGKNHHVEIPYSKNGLSAETRKALRELGIKTVVGDNIGDWVTTQRDGDKVVLGNKKIIGHLMPDVVSMGLKDALYLIENLGLNVQVKGRGSVRHQSVPPGTRITNGQTVVLEMSFTEG
ncbi:MAG: transpeptidase family protein [Bacteroidales bacterium]|nr:transpeptidase family protein [Bacteroidales bacterium]